MEGSQRTAVSSSYNEVSSPKLHTALYLTYFVSCALIICAAQGDLWLDEIWSLLIARAASTSCGAGSRAISID
jgi:hypothetical protein